MKTSLRITMLGVVAVPLTWITVQAIGAGEQRPPAHGQQQSTQWDDSLALNHQQPGPPGPGRRGEEGRPPPRNDGFGRPGEHVPRGGGPEGGRPDGPQLPRYDGPPPRRPDDRPPHERGGGQPRYPGLGGRSHVDHLREVDPEMAELVEQDQEFERLTFEMVAAMRNSPAEKRKELRSSLQDIVSKHFEVRQNRRKLELERLEAELTRLRETIETRTEAREEIVNRRIAEVLGEDQLEF